MANKFNSSDYRNKAVFQRRTLIEDEYGATSMEWSDTTRAGVSIRQISMRESHSAGIEITEEVLRLTAPAHKGLFEVLHTDRVMVSGGYFSIIQIDKFDPQNRFITFVVRRIQGD